jgi:UDP-N-acetylmuramoyl-L-alanyl-D-glutamate--2,6-diaminopimelate ligase
MIWLGSSDNPRTEDPNQIIADIAAGLPNAKAMNVTIEPDREKAIGLAITSAAKDDIILIAGKGHENYQIIGKEKRHFSDQEVSEKFLSEPRP